MLNGQINKLLVLVDIITIYSDAHRGEGLRGQNLPPSKKIMCTLLIYRATDTI